MESTPSAGYVTPQPRIPKVIGILNITFGAALMICGLCSGFYVATLPIFSKAMSQFAKQAEAEQAKQVNSQIDILGEEEKAAKTEEEKIAIARKKQELEDSLKKPLIAPAMDMNKMGLSDPRLVGFMWTDVLTGLVLNALLIVSGIALVRFKPIGLKLGMWVAGAKILRLILLWTFFIVGIVPWYSRKTAEYAVGMLQQPGFVRPGKGAGAPPIELLIRTYVITYTATGITMMVVGAIYPAVCLWLLSRPGARAACVASKTLEARGEAW